MKTTVTALTSILLALALTGTAVGSLPEIELPEQAVPTGGVAGQAIGCDVEGDGGFVFGYGKNGVPSSSGSSQAPCNYNGSDEHSGDVTHSVLKVTGEADYGYTSAYGFDSSTWDSASHYVYCNGAASLLVDWTGDEPAVTYLEGDDETCNISLSGSVAISDLNWYAYGGGRGGSVKFVHTDNLADALVHLLA